MLDPSFTPDIRLFEAMILVIIVVMLFLQNWRAAVIPIVAIPVSLIGTFVSNYARTQVYDRLARINGVGSLFIAAERAYAMRIWIDPEKAFIRDLTTSDVVNALRENNVQVAAGVINQQPIEANGAFE